MLERWTVGRLEGVSFRPSNRPTFHLPLTLPAKCRRSQVDLVGLHELPSAVHALFTASTIHPQRELKPATLAGAGAIVPQRRARRCQRTLEYVHDRGVEPGEFLEGQTVGGFRGIESCIKQRFIGVNVADACQAP